MISRRKWAIGAVTVMLVLAAGYTVGVAQGPAKGRPTATAVCDVQKVFEGLAEKVQADADINTRADRLKEEQGNRAKEIDTLQQALNLLAAGTPAHAQKQEELERKAVELRVWQELQAQKLNRERSVQYQALYRKMVEAIGRLSRDSGFDLVLFKEAAADFTNVRPEQLPTVLQIRKVLWSADELDITKQVIQTMNNEYKNLAPAKSGL